MSGTYCLTALEAAEMAGIELDELMALIAGDRRLAVQSGDSWRVDPDALHATLGRATFLKAAWRRTGVAVTRAPDQLPW